MRSPGLRFRLGREFATPFFLICAMGFGGRVSYEMIRSPVSALYARHIGVPMELIGLVVGAVTITGMLLKFPAGALADEWGVRRVMRAGLIVKATAPFLYLLAWDWPVLFGVRLYHGISSALFAPAAAAQVARLYPHRRGWRLGIYSSAEHVGVVIGPLLGGILLKYLGFSVTFAVAGAIGIATLLLIMAYPKDAPPQTVRRQGGTAQHLWARVRMVAGEPAILLVCLVEAIVLAAMGTMQAYLPLYQRSIHIPIVEIGALHAVEAFASILARPLVGLAGDRFGRAPFVLTGLAMSAGALATLPHVTDISTLVGLQTLFGVGVGLVTPSTVAMVADLVEHDEFGSVMGAFGSLADIGHACGPLLAGLVIAWFGYAAGFGAMAVLLVAAMVLFMIGSRAHTLATAAPERAASGP